MHNTDPMEWYQLVPYRSSKQTPGAFAQLLMALVGALTSQSFLNTVLGKSKRMVLEIVAQDASIGFYIGIPKSLSSYLEGQLRTSYPTSSLREVKDPLHKHFSSQGMAKSTLGLKKSTFVPLQTYEGVDRDPLLSVLGALAKFGAQETGIVEIVISDAGVFPEATSPSLDQSQQKMQEKNKHGKHAIQTQIRLIVVSEDANVSKVQLNLLASAFGSYALEQGNAFQRKFSLFDFGGWDSIRHHRFQRGSSLLLSPEEVASLFHLPDGTQQQLRNIQWGGEAFFDTPENLPVIGVLNEKEKLVVNFFAKTEYKNKETTFGIKNGMDRRKHMYLIGKTGVGKSTLLANMAISDIRKGHGVAVIDPHGELSEILLHHIPTKRINDVCYLDPSDLTRTFGLNPLEVKSDEQREFVVSGVISIFQKLYAYTWGPRLEYLLRNALLTLMYVNGATFLDIPTLLTQDGYREHIVENLKDKVLRDFWRHEYAQFSEKFRQEAISPILNKVGQFISIPLLRNILAYKHSTVDLESMMNQGKIVILNLSAGKIGEDVAALLGALFISKFQLAAMKRAHVKEEDRKDFYLYVDEFQNFSTLSFVKILSEARKYHLNLILANQYMDQLSEDIQSAILGNVGSLVSFTVGSADARILEREFGKIFSEQDLVSLDKYAIALKLSIDGKTSQPFMAKTLPLPTKSRNENREKVITASNERYTQKARSL